MNLHEALTNLRQRFMRSVNPKLKQSKTIFNFGAPKIIDRVYNITKDYALRIKFDFSGIGSIYFIHTHSKTQWQFNILYFSYEAKTN